LACRSATDQEPVSARLMRRDPVEAARLTRLLAASPRRLLSVDPIPTLSMSAGCQLTVEEILLDLNHRSIDIKSPNDNRLPDIAPGTMRKQP
jgi:hypothetical protein